MFIGSILSTIFASADLQRSHRFMSSPTWFFYFIIWHPLALFQNEIITLIGKRNKRLFKYECQRNRPHGFQINRIDKIHLKKKKDEEWAKHLRVKEG
ncbi:hypothetical protein V7266_10890 [Neobacillus drentensis]|uniref:hypothetical protein n=1 Tax=Neobacillus drentensis TaxID=220684 RepID=UPI002FFF5021